MYWLSALNRRPAKGNITQYKSTPERCCQTNTDTPNEAPTQSALMRARRGSRHGEQLLHHNDARSTLQTAFDRDALIDRAFEQLIERR